MAGSSPAKRAPRKQTRPAAKPAGPKVTLDLDSLEKSRAFPDLKLPKEPFTFLLDGVMYELRDPRDSDWKLALQLAGNPFLLMRTALVGADDPIDDPTEDEMEACRERHGLVSKDTRDLAKLVSDGTLRDAEGNLPDEEDEDQEPVPALIDRFTAAYLPGWKLNALFARWHDHYKIDLSKGTGILGALLGQSE